MSEPIYGTMVKVGGVNTYIGDDGEIRSVARLEWDDGASQIMLVVPDGSVFLAAMVEGRFLMLSVDEMPKMEPQF